MLTASGTQAGLPGSHQVLNPTTNNSRISQHSTLLKGSGELTLTWVRMTTTNLPNIVEFSLTMNTIFYHSLPVRPSDLQGHFDIHLFKSGIKPMWEVSTTRFRESFNVSEHHLLTKVPLQ